MEIYYAFHLNTKDEVVIALLSDIGFESFVEEDETTVAYISQTLRSASASQISDILSKFSVSCHVEEIQPQNWNALWEESFTPVLVEPFIQIRADFHKPRHDVKFDIIINPKMAFGTGHHATTLMMVKSMENVDFQGKNVLDYGAGTGILAILASKMGCDHADAIDIEYESFNNMLENFLINNITNVHAVHGTLENLDPTDLYDVILANINRNVLLQSARELYSMLKVGGKLLLSGILIEDIEMILSVYTSLGFVCENTLTENKWACIQCIRK